ncbi:TPA: hypothetical protein QFF40_000310 [Enterococcus faecium]
MLIIKRKKKVEVADELGLTIQTITKWTLHDDTYQRIANEVAHRYFTDLIGDSIYTVKKLLNARSEKVRLDAANSILDRAGLKPIEKVDATHDVNFEIVIGEYAEEEE